MTIIEALTSGKKFKREGWDDWLIKPESDLYAHIDSESMQRSSFLFSCEDIVATDWIVEETEVKVTKSQLARAVNKCLEKCLLVQMPQDIFTNDLCKELGLEE